MVFKNKFFENTKQRIDILRERKAPPPPLASIETSFPCLYKCTVGYRQLDRQTATAVYSRQRSYTDREKASQGGCFPFSKDIYSLKPKFKSFQNCLHVLVSSLKSLSHGDRSSVSSSGTSSGSSVDAAGSSLHLTTP